MQNYKVNSTYPALRVFYFIKVQIVGPALPRGDGSPACFSTGDTLVPLRRKSACQYALFPQNSCFSLTRPGLNSTSPVFEIPTPGFEDRKPPIENSVTAIDTSAACLALRLRDTKC